VRTKYANFRADSLNRAFQEILRPVSDDLVKTIFPLRRVSGLSARHFRALKWLTVPKRDPVCDAGPDNVWCLKESYWVNVDRSICYAGLLALHSPPDAREALQMSPRPGGGWRAGQGYRRES
jgi:hypothetical protein